MRAGAAASLALPAARAGLAAPSVKRSRRDQVFHPGEDSAPGPSPGSARLPISPAGAEERRQHRTGRPVPEWRRILQAAVGPWAPASGSLAHLRRSSRHLRLDPDRCLTTPRKSCPSLSRLQASGACAFPAKNSLRGEAREASPRLRPGSADRPCGDGRLGPPGAVPAAPGAAPRRGVEPVTADGRARWAGWSEPVSGSIAFFLRIRRPSLLHILRRTSVRRRRRPDRRLKSPGGTATGVRSPPGASFVLAFSAKNSLVPTAELLVGLASPGG
jgi:hypothetical protein